MEKFNIFFVDDELNSSLTVMGAVLALKQAGHSLVGETTSPRETIARIKVLQAENIIATLGIIDGLNGYGVKIDEMLKEAFPDIKTLAFSNSPPSPKFGNGWLAKQAARSIVSEASRIMSLGK